MYDVSSTLFWYRLVFTGELILAELLTSYRLYRRKNFVLRVAGAIAICLGAAFAVPVVSNGAAWMSLMFLAIFAATLGALKLCFDERMSKILLCAVLAYTMQHIAYQLNDAVMTLTGAYRTDNPYDPYGNSAFAILLYGYSGMTYVAGNPFTIMMYAYIYGMIYFFGYLIVKKRLGDGSNFQPGNMKMFWLAVMILFFDVVISAVIMQYSSRNLDVFYAVLLDAYNIACCLFAILLLLGIIRGDKLQSDLVTVEKMWNEKKEQYAITKDSIDLINRKCHDLKHQLRRADGSIADEGLVREIEDIVTDFDASVRTGNEALDIIVTEKSRLCNRKKIRLCCMADGKKLSFMRSSDLYALFGNIIDNAIEAVSVLDEDKRTISLSVSEKSGFIVINIYNRYDGELSFESGLPRTTKSDESMHGFGMKSVQATCEKYGGSMSIRTDKNVFNLNIIIPKTEEKG